MPSNFQYGMQLGGERPDYGENVEIHEEAIVSTEARIYGSTRGTRISIGAHTQVFDFVVIRAAGGVGDIEIGEHCYLGPHAVLYSANGISLGDNSLIGAGTHITPAHHDTADREQPIRVQGFKPSRGGVVTEGDCIVGVGCILLDGTHIGRGAIIGAGSLVRGPVPPNTVWAGNPLRQIGER
jgi:acetyltransferase-like isoleucine patch superfamily enzyme